MDKTLRNLLQSNLSSFSAVQIKLGVDRGFVIINALVDVVAYSNWDTIPYTLSDFIWTEFILADFILDGL